MLYITLHNAFKLAYKEVYDDRLAVQAVSDDFAERFSLPVNLCTAWHLNKRLAGDESLLQVGSTCALCHGALSRQTHVDLTEASLLAGGTTPAELDLQH